MNAGFDRMNERAVFADWLAEGKSVAIGKYGGIVARYRLWDRLTRPQYMCSMMRGQVRDVDLRL